MCEPISFGTLSEEKSNAALERPSTLKVPILSKLKFPGFFFMITEV